MGRIRRRRPGHGPFWYSQISVFPQSSPKLDLDSVARVSAVVKMDPNAGCQRQFTSLRPATRFRLGPGHLDDGYVPSFTSPHRFHNLDAHGRDHNQQQGMEWPGKSSRSREADGPGGHLELLALRLYNPDSHQWNVNFATSNVGVLSVPCIGDFRKGRGEFYDQESLDGESILVRFQICHSRQIRLNPNRLFLMTEEKPGRQIGSTNTRGLRTFPRSIDSSTIGRLDC